MRNTQGASQPAVIGLLRSTGLPHIGAASLADGSQRCELLTYIEVSLLKNVIILVTTTPIDINPAEVLHMVVTRLRAKCRYRTTQCLGGVWQQRKWTDSHNIRLD